MATENLWVPMVAVTGFQTTDDTNGVRRVFTRMKVSEVAGFQRRSLEDTNTGVAQAAASA
jgi:hypothetical protein